MDISIDIGDNLFNFRVGAVIKNQNKILVHHDKNKEHITLIGGRIKSGEDSITALKREIKEEIGADTEYVKPVAYVENFFEEKGKKYHHNGRVRQCGYAERYNRCVDERSRVVGFVRCNRPDHSGRDKGSLQEWHIKGVWDKAYHTHIRQLQHGSLQS